MSSSSSKKDLASLKHLVVRLEAFGTPLIGASVIPLAVKVEIVLNWRCSIIEFTMHLCINIKELFITIVVYQI